MNKLHGHWNIDTVKLAVLYMIKALLVMHQLPIVLTGEFSQSNYVIVTLQTRQVCGLQAIANCL